MGDVNKYLVKERERCTFNVKELTNLIDGGEQNTMKRKEIENYVFSIKGLKDEVPEENLSYKERYENAVRKGCILFPLLIKWSEKPRSSMDSATSNNYKIVSGVIKDISPFMLHFRMFLPTIATLASPEQQRDWLKKRSQMIGAYAQTELGHGTFLRGLETTATYDSATEEFVIHSPTLTSYKWWAGGLAQTANYCIVIAQLYIGGKNYGIHAFLVQIRDLETHKPLPGIKIGDIGPKLGFQTANNGFLGFYKYRIPRTNMLMRNAQVLKDGTYVKAKNDKLTYGTMVFVRVTIVVDVAFELSRAVTIAVRYAAVRHQSQPKSGEGECQILDYVTQQHKLFIAIATSHAFTAVGRWLWKTYKQVENDMGKGCMEQLPELHALACCLKAVCSRDATVCVEQCRFACGGHGYMTSSNLPVIYGIVSATVTFEGEYTVMLLQTARFLVKSFQRAAEGKALTRSFAYLAKFLDNYKEHICECTPQGIIDGFQLVAVGKTKEAYKSILEHIKSGKGYQDAWFLSSVQLVYASEYSCMTKGGVDKLQKRYEQLLALIRPNAVGLVDAFDLRDEILCSTLVWLENKLAKNVFNNFRYWGFCVYLQLTRLIKEKYNKDTKMSGFIVNEDLVRERSKCTFDIKELTHLIDGGEQNTLERKEIEDYVLSIKELRDEIPEEYLSHKERYENAVRKGCILFSLLLQRSIKRKSSPDSAISNNYKVVSGVIKDISPFLLHFGMFLPTIVSQASPEQQEQWLQKGWQMIGTYAQTELGHGTFLRGLETTATYDPATEEFVIHSPTLTSYKWWPGGLAQTANHCIVMAQLYIGGKSYGIHAFLVQIRDLETHKPLPGIKVGDIGPKLGFQTANNGFLGFDNYRIPRNNMLMKNAQVQKDGTYVKAKNDKLTYGTMVFVRVTIVTDVAFELSRAATIAVRYAAVRHQSQPKAGEPEPQILDYVTQQHKLFIAIATSHAFRVVGRWLWKDYTRVVADMGAGNMDQLPELHALACCLKAVCSRDATACVEQCRFACGGHGYMISSNLPIIYGIVSASVTYEGEYTVMLLQTARYLVKSYKLALEGKSLNPTVAYLAKFMNNNAFKWENSPQGIIEGLQAVAAGKTNDACESLLAHVKCGKDYEDAWNLSSVQLVIASEAHARAVLCEMFWREILKVSSTVTNSLACVLQQLAELYLSYWALERRGDILMFTTASKEDMTRLQQRYEDLLALIRPNAVGLVDAFDVRDEILCSTLGAYDGRVYERLMEQAMKSPLNSEPVNQSFNKYIKPIVFKSKI
ncbi:unnamed protein product, partial [Iphiclides podalirius]